MAKHQPPEHLRAAYDWTAAAHELGDLAQLSDEALDAYCRESAENCAEHGDGDVSADDLRDLHDWLVRHSGLL